MLGFAAAVSRVAVIYRCCAEHYSAGCNLWATGLVVLLGVATCTAHVQSTARSSDSCKRLCLCGGGMWLNGMCAV